MCAWLERFEETRRCPPHHPCYFGTSQSAPFFGWIFVQGNCSQPKHWLKLGLVLIRHCHQEPTGLSACQVLFLNVPVQSKSSWLFILLLWPCHRSLITAFEGCQTAFCNSRRFAITGSSLPTSSPRQLGRKHHRPLRPFDLFRSPLASWRREKNVDAEVLLEHWGTTKKTSSADDAHLTIRGTPQDLSDGGWTTADGRCLLWRRWRNLR
jgi:hypothetical protein